MMNEEQLLYFVKDIIRDLLTIELENYRNYDGKGFKIIVKLDNEIITEDYYITDTDGYYW